MPTIRSLLSTGMASSPALAGVEGPGLDHARLRSVVEATAARIRTGGILAGDPVAIVMRNRPETATAFLAVTLAGVAAPLNPAYGHDELDFYLGDVGARLLLVEAGLDTPAREVARRHGIAIAEVDAAPGGGLTVDGTVPADGPCSDVAPDSGSVALILHTSGTTSRPKLVPLTHGNLAASARRIAATLALSSDDRSLTIMPLFHIHGLVAGLLAPLAAGGAVIVPPGFVASEFASWLGSTRPTWYTAVPTMHQAILDRLATDEGRALRALAPLRFIRSSSASMPPRVIRDLEGALGIPVIEAYGMTEAAHQMASNPLPPGVRKPGSVGRAAGPEIAIMDEAGQMLEAGAIGEVVIRGTSVTAGYVSNPVANAAGFTNGWFRTGDQGYLDADHYLTLTGRLKELINRAGEKVAPLEVDAVLMEHPAVAQAICFGIPHPILGEEVAAVVVAQAGATVDRKALRTFVASRLAYFKVPRQIRLVDRIPTGATGKLQRRGLAEALGMVAEVPVISGDRTPPRTPAEEIVASVWRDTLRRDVPGVRENFFALGGDSILATRVVARLRDLLHVELPLMAFFDAPTVAGLAAEVDHLLTLDDVRV